VSENVRPKPVSLKANGIIKLACRGVEFLIFRANVSTELQVELLFACTG